jgi:hypothetical protein
MQNNLTDEVRRAVLSKIPEEPSDTKLAKAFGISRKTIWRLRKTLKRNEIIPPPLKKAKRTKLDSLLSIPKVVEKEPEIKVTPEVKEPISEIKVALQYEKPKPEPILKSNVVQLITHFAIQLLRRENFKDVAYEVISAAASAKILFRKLQVLDDQLSIGATTFVRFRADIQDIHPLIEHLKERAYICVENDAFVVQFPDGRKGKYPSSIMCATPHMGPNHFFAGTRIARWKYQFESKLKEGSLS